MDIETHCGKDSLCQAGFPQTQGLPCSHCLPSEKMGNQGLERGARPRCNQGSGLRAGFRSLTPNPAHAQVQSRRCDMKTKFVTHIPCTPCPAIKKRVCPSGWLREFPEKISQDCRCRPPLHPCLLPGVSRGMAGDQEGLAGLGSEGRDSLIHMSVGPSSRTEIGREEGVRMQGKCCLLSIYYGSGPVFSSGPGMKGSGDQEQQNPVWGGWAGGCWGSPSHHPPHPWSPDTRSSWGTLCCL